MVSSNLSRQVNQRANWGIVLASTCVALLSGLGCTKGTKDVGSSGGAATTAPASTPAPGGGPTGTLAISVGQELANTISLALVESGISESQAHVITNDVTSSGVLAIQTGSSLNLADQQDLNLVAPNVAGAFVANLDSPAAGLDEETRKKAIGVIVSATVKFTGEKQIDDSARPALIGAIAETVVTKTAEASLSTEATIDAIGLVADASFSGMVAGKISPDSLTSTAQVIADKIGRGVAATALSTDKIPDALGKAAEKAGSALGKLPLPDPTAAVSSTTEGFVSGLAASTRLTKDEKNSALAEIPKGVSTSIPAWMATDKLASALDKVTTTTVDSFVAKLSPSAAEIAAYLPKIAEGAVVGLAKSSASTSTIVANDIASRPMQAIMGKLDQLVSDSQGRMQVIQATLTRSISALGAASQTNAANDIAPQLVSKAFELATANRGNLNLDVTDETKVTNFYDTMIKGAIEGVAKLGTTNRAAAAAASSSILSKTMDAAVSSMNTIYTATGSGTAPNLSENVLKSIPTRASQAVGEKLATVLPPDDLNGAFATITSQYIYNVQTVATSKSTTVDVGELSKTITADSLATFCGAWNAKPTEMQTAVTALNNRLGVMGTNLDPKVLASIQTGSRNVVVQAIGGKDAMQSCSDTVTTSTVACTKVAGASCPSSSTQAGYKYTWNADATGERCFMYRELIVDTTSVNVTCSTESEYVYGVGCRPKVKTCAEGEAFVYGVGCKTTTFFCPVGQRFSMSGGCVADDTTYTCPTGQRRTASGSCEAATTTCASGYTFVTTQCVAVSATPQCPTGAPYNASQQKCVAVSTTTSNSSTTCTSGTYRNNSGSCNPFGQCASGQFWDATSLSCRTNCTNATTWDSVSLTCHSITIAATQCADGKILVSGSCETCPTNMPWDPTAKACRALGSCSPGLVFNPDSSQCEKAQVATCDNTKSKPEMPQFTLSNGLIGGIQLGWSGAGDAYLLVRRSGNGSYTVADGKPYELRSRFTDTNGSGETSIVIFRGNGTSFADFDAKDSSRAYGYDLYAVNFLCTGPTYSSASTVSVTPKAIESLSSVTAALLSTSGGSGSTTQTDLSSVLSPVSELVATPIPPANGSGTTGAIKLSWSRAKTTVGSSTMSAVGYVLVRHAPTASQAALATTDFSPEKLYPQAQIGNGWTVVFMGDNDNFTDATANYQTAFQYAISPVYMLSNGTATERKFATLATTTNPVANSNGTSAAFAGIALSGMVTDRILNRFEANSLSPDPLVANLVASGHDPVKTSYAVVTTSSTCNDTIQYLRMVPSLATLSSDLVGLNDGSTYRVCVRLESSSGEPAFGSSPAFNVDTTPPAIIYAGSDSMDVSGSSSQLQVTVTGDVQNIQWFKTYGPAEVSFGSPSSATTTMSATTAGIYGIRIRALDSAGNFSVKDLTINYQPSGPTQTSGTLAALALNGPQAVIADTCSAPFVIDLLNSSGTKISISSGISISLGVPSGVTVYMDGTCSAAAQSGPSGFYTVPAITGSTNAVFFLKAAPNAPSLIGLSAEASSVTASTRNVYKIGITLASSAGDLLITAGERAATGDLLSISGLPSGTTASYSVVKSPNICTDYLSYSAIVPRLETAFSSGVGSYRVCLRIGDSSRFFFGRSDEIVVQDLDQTVLRMVAASLTQDSTCLPVTLSLQNSSGAAVTATSTQLFNLPTGMRGVTTYSDATCSNSANSASIPSGGSSTQFWVRTDASSYSPVYLSASAATGSSLTASLPLNIVRLNSSGNASDMVIAVAERSNGSTNIVSISGIPTVLTPTFSYYKNSQAESACPTTGSAYTLSGAEQSNFAASTGAAESFTVCAKVAVGNGAMYLQSPKITVMDSSTSSTGSNVTALAIKGKTYVSSGGCFPFDIEARNVDGLVNPSSALPVSLNVSSGNVQLFSDNTCSTTLSNPTIGTDTNKVTVYLRAGDAASQTFSLNAIGGSLVASMSINLVKFMLANAAFDGQISQDEQSNINPVVTLSGAPSGIAGYAIVSAVQDCTASMTLYPLTAYPTAQQVYAKPANADYRICGRIQMVSGEYLYVISPIITVSSTSSQLAINGSGIAPGGSCSPYVVVLPTAPSSSTSFSMSSGPAISLHSDADCSTSSITAGVIASGMSAGTIYANVPPSVSSAFNLNATAGSLFASKTVSVLSISLAGVAADGWINANDKSANQSILTLGQMPSDIMTEITLVSGLTRCNAAANYQSFITAPTASSLATTPDGASYRYCFRFTKGMDTLYGSSPNFDIDTIAPTIVDAGADQVLSSLTPITVTGSGPDGLVYEWKGSSGLQIQAYAQNPKSATVTPVAAGTYGLRFVASDAAGNQTFDEVQVTWNAPITSMLIPGLDKLPWFACVPQKVQLPSQAPAVMTVDLSLSSGSGASFYNDASCNSPSTSVSVVAGATEGQFFVRASEAATSPISIMTSLASGTTTLNTTKAFGVIAVNFKGPAADGYINYADAGLSDLAIEAPVTPTDWKSEYAVTLPAASCSGQTYTTSIPTAATLSAGADGPRRVCVRYTVGPLSLYSSSLQVTVDKTAPTASLGSVPSSVTVLTGLNISANVSGASSYNWIQESGSGTLAFANASGTLGGGTTSVATTVTPSAAGTYGFKLSVNDAAGNSAVSNVVNVSWTSSTGPTSTTATSLKWSQAPRMLASASCQPITLSQVDSNGNSVSGVTTRSIAIELEGPAQVYSDNTCVTLITGTPATVSLASTTQVYVRAINAGEVKLMARDSAMGAAGTTQLAPALETLIVDNKIYTGGNHTCLLSTSGTTCWGSNNFGQLGTGSANLTENTPTTVTSVTSTAVRQLALGQSHTCAMLNDYTVKCWGNNSSGQLGYASGGPATSVAFANSRSPRYLVAGEQHNCAIMDDMSVQCWGGNANGQLGQNDTVAKTGVVALPGTDKFRSLAAGANHNCGIAIGPVGMSIKCWGLNSSGQAGNSLTTSPVTTATAVASGTGSALGSGYMPMNLATGSTHSCAVAKASSISMTASLVCWGNNSSGQLTGSGDKTAPFAVTLPTAVSPGYAVAGVNHTCVVNAAGPAAGSMYCWGSNTQGQLGSGSLTSSSTVPTSAISLSTGTTFFTSQQYAAGNNHTCGLKPSSPYFTCWGDNSLGQSANGATTNTTRPN
ncbi:MAG: Ig-like domain repeat protein [Proteobacteria bacterium]|nr:Ig-like domain repeat protein [Pseudomonadota bacterium]